MNIKLVKLSREYQKQLFEVLDEWKHDVEVNHTNHSPSAIFRHDYHDLSSILRPLNRMSQGKDSHLIQPIFVWISIEISLWEQLIFAII